MNPAAPARPLTILHLLPALDSGGVEQHVLTLAAAQQHAGYRPIILSHGGKLVPLLTEQGIEHHTLPIHRKSLLSLLQICALRRRIAQLQPHLLHLHSRVPAWLAHYALRGLKHPPPTVSTVHGLYSVNRYSRIMTRADRVIAVSEATRQYILQNYPDTPPSRIRLIPNGIDPQRHPRGLTPSPQWLQQWQQDYPQLTGKQLLTLPGRLTRIKGHPDFIDLIARLRTQHPHVHGLIVGDTQSPKARRYRKTLEAQIARLGLQGSITFTGQRQDLPEIYAISHIIYSLTTQPESFGLTLAEALAQGTPVLGWAHGGAAEILHAMYPDGAIPLGNRTHLYARSHQLLTQHTRPPIAPLPPAYTQPAMCHATLSVYHELIPATQEPNP